MTVKEWGESLKAQIHNSQDHPMFDELLGCLESNFLRSAYIMSWIAISENLKNKILQSSNLGDAAAAAALKAIEDAEVNKKSVDRIILDKAVDLNLTDPTEKGILEFLWTQRCLFAHPYQLAPNLDETKYIINQLIGICLSKPLLYKKGFITELINNLVSKPFFLPNDEAEIIKYYSGILPRITQDLHPFLFKSLLSELGKVEVDETKTDIQLKLRLFLIKLLTESPLSLTDTKWSLEPKTVGYPFTTLYGCVSYTTWPKFSDRIKQILVDYALTEIDETKRYRIKCAFHELIYTGVLELNFQNRYFDFLENIRFNWAINFYANPSKKHSRILADFDTSSYDKQNAVIDFLKSENGKALIKELGEVDQRSIGNRLVYAARNNNWNANNYFNSLSEIDSTSKGFVFGLIEGTLFNRLNNFYIDLERYQTAVRILKHIPLEDALDILKQLNVLVVGKAPENTHNLEETNIDTAKLKLEDLQSEIKDQAVDLLENLKQFKYVWPII